MTWEYLPYDWPFAKHFPYYWSFVRGIHRSTVDSPYKGHWRGLWCVLLDISQNKQLDTHWSCRRFETLWCSLWRHRNVSSVNHQPFGALIRKAEVCGTFCLHVTSSNGNISRVTGHLCGEFTGHRWIPGTKASDAELWCFLWSAPE